MTPSLYKLFYSRELSRAPLTYTLYRNISWLMKKNAKDVIYIKIVNHYLCEEYMHTKCVIFQIDD